MAKDYYENSMTMSQNEIDDLALSLPPDEGAIDEMLKEIMHRYFEVPESKFRASGRIEDLRVMATWGRVLPMLLKSYVSLAIERGLIKKMQERKIEPSEAN